MAHQCLRGIRKVNSAARLSSSKRNIHGACPLVGIQITGETTITRMGSGPLTGSRFPCRPKNTPTNSARGPMFTISLQQLRAAGACTDKLAAWATRIGGDESPQPFARLLDCSALGPSEWYWATRCLTAAERRKIYIGTIIPAARRAVVVWERGCPADGGPRRAVEAAELALLEPTKANCDAAAAADAVYADADAATCAAACYAARAASAASAAAGASAAAAAGISAYYATRAASAARAELAQQRQDWLNTLASF